MLNLLKLVALKRYDYVLYLQLVQNKMAYLFVYERKKERDRPRSIQLSKKLRDGSG